VSVTLEGLPLAAVTGIESALVAEGSERIRSGEPVVFCKVVAVAPAVVRRDGRVQAAGSPAGHATLGPLEEWLEAQAGPGIIKEIAERAVLDARFVKGARERLLTSAFMIRAIVLMILAPNAPPEASTRRSTPSWSPTRCCAQRSPTPPPSSPPP
jgi:hypothetical protein